MCWFFDGTELTSKDNELFEIDERRIVRAEPYEKSELVMDFLNTKAETA